MGSRVEWSKVASTTVSRSSLEEGRYVYMGKKGEGAGVKMGRRESGGGGERCLEERVKMGKTGVEKVCSCRRGEDCLVRVGMRRLG